MTTMGKNSGMQVPCTCKALLYVYVHLPYVATGECVSMHVYVVRILRHQVSEEHCDVSVWRCHCTNKDIG